MIGLLLILEKTITIKQIAQLTKIAFQSAFTQVNITKAFEKPGVWPVNRLAFRDEDFVASYVNIDTDESTENRPIPNNQLLTHQTNNSPSTSTTPSVQPINLIAQTILNSEESNNPLVNADQSSASHQTTNSPAISSIIIPDKGI